MDAPDDNRDIKLYRASVDLLPEISQRLGGLLTGIFDTKEPPDHQLWVPESQVQKLINILEPFQEWPQLLDPNLPELVKHLVDAFLQYLAADRHTYRRQSSAPRPGLSPLPSAICCILNTFCKVRGVKVITRFLNNEPKYLEPMLQALLLNQSDIDWQERYIMLLWLSHLVLTPFDLQSISSSHEPLLTQALLPEELGDQGIPVIVSALVSAGLENLGAASKERESASRLIVRIALRPDMQRLGQLDRLVKLIFAKLEEYTQSPTASTYDCLGFLSVVSGIIKTGSADDVLPFLTTIINFCLEAATTKSAKPNMIRASAPARKMLVAILRTSMLHAIALNSRDGVKQISDNALYGILEDIIQYLLEALGDKDTPVRLAASKALSMLVQKLDESMKIEIVQAVLDMLEEDILYEKSESGGLRSASSLTKKDKQVMMRNFTAVSPLKWQGLLLTLGHLLFRRTVPPDQLSPVLKSLLFGLEFEQRAASGTSVGGSVRDAACFGFWSLARNYATSELQAVEPTSILPTLKTAFYTTTEISVLQIVANQLVISACLDPSGNIRRGSSAALQELIGRHPDMIIQGIALVQIVDYHAVARRSRAMLEVAGGAAELDNVYRWVLLNALLEWRGARAVDDGSRRIAAAAISKLLSSEPLSDRCAILEAAYMQLSRLPTENSKTIVEVRHGLLMTVSRILAILQPTSLSSPSYLISTPVASMLQVLWGDVKLDGQLLGNLRGRFIAELIVEGVASLMSSLAGADSIGLLKSSERVIDVLNVCLTRADNDAALLACADASFELLSRLPTSQRVELVESWLDSKGRRHLSFSCKGRILALGNIFAVLPANPVTNYDEREVSCRSKVFAQLTDFILGNWHIETQVIALRSLKSTVTHLEAENCEQPLGAGLDNYANDHRGDVGSLARFEAVKAVSALLTEWTERQDDTSNHQSLKPLVQRVFRLAGEKLDKLRFEAWKCIEVYMKLVKMHSAESFSHVVDVSSERYYLTLLQFLGLPWLQSCIIQGIIHSIASGTEDLMRASRHALFRSISKAQSDGDGIGILEILVTLLEDSYTDDRQAVPLLETIAIVMEQRTELEGDNGHKLPTRQLWNVVRRAHFKSTNVRKLEASVRIYAALARQGDMRRNGLCKLRDLLLHPYPSIRNAAADALYLELPNELLKIQDWSHPLKELKEQIKLLSEDVTELAKT